MFDENAFSLDAFDQDSWLFAFDTPYEDLSPDQRVYVATVIRSLYVTRVADQIIAVAKHRNLSIVDASRSVVSAFDPAHSVLTESSEGAALVAGGGGGRNIQVAEECESARSKPELENIYSLSGVNGAYVSARTESIFVVQSPHRLWAADCEEVAASILSSHV